MTCICGHPIAEHGVTGLCHGIEEYDDRITRETAKCLCAKPQPLVTNPVTTPTSSV